MSVSTLQGVFQLSPVMEKAKPAPHHSITEYGLFRVVTLPPLVVPSLHQSCPGDGNRQRVSGSSVGEVIDNFSYISALSPPITRIDFARKQIESKAPGHGA